MAVVLNELEGTDEWKPENVMDDNDFVMTNIAEDGSIVPLHNRLKLKEKVSVDSLIALLHHFPLGYWENEETHLYRFYPDAEPALGTVEWGSMADACLAALQRKFISGWEKLSARIAAEKDPARREEIMTAEHKRMSEEAHSLALALYRHLVYGEPFDGAGGEPEKAGKTKERNH